MLHRLFSDVDETRKTAFARQPRNDVEESLAAFECVVAFNLPDSFRVGRTRVVPPTRDLGQMLSRVFDCEDLEAGLGQQPLVLAPWHKQEEPDRGPDRDFIAVEVAVHGDRIGKEEPPARPQRASPVGENTRAVGQMVDRVDAEERVETVALERERSAGVGLHEAPLRL